MFKRIQHAIARIIQAMHGATSTQPAGHAPQGHTIQTGKAPSVSVGISPHPLPASKLVKRKPKAAQSTSVAPSRKLASKPAQTTSGKRGRPRKIAA